MGVPNESLTAVSRSLAAQLGAIHIQTGELLRTLSSANTADSTTVRDAIESGRPVPDDLVNKTVAAALKEPRVLEHGYVLQGYPANPAQAAFLASLPVPQPSRALVLDYDTGAVKRHLQARRWDPVARRFYNLQDGTPPPVVAKRLVVAAHDQEEAIERRLALGAQAVQVVRQAFPECVRVLDAKASVRFSVPVDAEGGCP